MHSRELPGTIGATCKQRYKEINAENNTARVESLCKSTTEYLYKGTITTEYYYNGYMHYRRTQN